MGKYPKLVEYSDRVYGQPELKEYLAKRKMWMRQQEKKKKMNDTALIPSLAI
jgi:hypothetical protein